MHFDFYDNTDTKYCSLFLTLTVPAFILKVEQDDPLLPGQIKQVIYTA